MRPRLLAVFIMCFMLRQRKNLRLLSNNKIDQVFVISRHAIKLGKKRNLTNARAGLDIIYQTKFQFFTHETGIYRPRNLIQLSY